jgi:patatin-like phospholipase/acyl hydrolase
MPLWHSHTKAWRTNPKPLRILALDGGGVRGISTLYILEDLMRQIARDHDAENPQGAALSTLPCDYFDGLADWKKLEIIDGSIHR